MINELTEYQQIHTLNEGATFTVEIIGNQSKKVKNSMFYEV